MKNEDYKLGQKVSLYGRIEAIDIENMHDIENTTTLKINTLARTISVNPKWEKVTIELDQPKLEVPQDVGTWFKSTDDPLNDYINLVETMHKYDGKNPNYNYDTGMYKWIRETPNSMQIVVNMHQFGYEVEKEKLYTVEIPNPNTLAITILARSNVGDVVMCNEFDNCWKKNSRYQLTEQEIRKDFDWAWQFAKEVTE